MVVLQQVFTLIQTILSKWLDDSEVVEVGGFLLYKCMCTVLSVSVHVWFSCVCVCVYWLTLTHSTPFPPSRLCVGYLINQFEPSYMISGPWWLSWVRCWGRSIVPSHKPQRWTWHVRYASTDQSLNKSIIPRNVMHTPTCFWAQMSLFLSFFLNFIFRWFSYLLERTITCLPLKALL